MKLSWIFSILFWGNLLIAISRFRGVTTTTRIARRAGRLFPISNGKLGDYSDKIDLLLRKVPFFFIARKQRCLVRGFLIYFFGKRRQMQVHLHFGSRKTDIGFDSHCWITHNTNVRFEVEDVIKQYTTLVEYN
jgi:hypothetical protein